ncbi:MAG: protein translocase subunit SecD [Planctomycetes bacterium]|nr:protein translocase subunit SecD [Planctomycetota bacterium]
MWEFFKKYHAIIVLVVAAYLAIPKPAPGPTDTLQWPLHRFKWNLGQDLSGGSSLRFRLVQQDMKDAEQSLRDLVRPLAARKEALSEDARKTFGKLIDGGIIDENSFKLRATPEEKDDFDKLLTPGVFDEGRVDAARKFFKTWRDASKRRTDNNLTGPTIETLYRRLGTIGITELNITPLGETQLEVKLPKFASASETQRYKDLLQTTGKLELRVLAPDKTEFTRLTPPELPKDEGYKYKWIPVYKDPKPGAKENSIGGEKDWAGTKVVLTQIIDKWDISGKDIENIVPSVGKEGGLAVSFDMKGLAVAKFEELTELHRKDAADPRLLAILIDEKVFNAYSIESKISGTTQISGRFAKQERDDLINVLKSGSLNVRLELEGEESVGPSEGAEAIWNGFMSFLIAALFVFAFALWLYRGLGVLVIFNLVLIVVIIMGAMSAGLGTLTLPGIAGLVLTFGMAIDGNILINERMREEYAKGANTRAAAEEGFKNALSAILDSNITTLLTALILYKVGSGPVQGFALTLAIGIVATLYANIPAYRSMVFWWIGKRRETRFTMADLSFLQNKNINFVAAMRWAMPLALVLSVAGIALFLMHGQRGFGTEFRGGHTFRVQFREPTIADDVRKAVEGNGKDGKPLFTSVETQPVFGLGEGGGGNARRYDFRFPMEDKWEHRDQNEVNNELKQQILSIFGDKIVEPGWVSRTVDPKEASFSVKLRLKLKNPDEFRRLYPEDMEKLWKIHERSWGGKESAPSDKKAEWFAQVVGTSPDAVVVPQFERGTVGGDEQIYRLTVSKVTIADEADLRAKADAFAQAIRARFIDDAERVIVADGVLPPTETNITRGGLEATVTLVQPIEEQKFIGAAEAFTKTVPSIAGTLNIVGVDKQGAGATATAQRFRLVTGVTDFNADRAQVNSFESVDGHLRDGVASWLAAEGKGNNISQPFLLANAIGATVAGETQVRALLAIAAALVVMIIYIRVRFASLAWGVAATMGIAFSTAITLGFVAAADMLGFDMKIDLTVIAALLTVIGYAINDTIVNFDRIREVLKKDRLTTGGKTPLRVIVNESANQMLTRTLMTGGTTLSSVLIMLFVGGPLLRGFAFSIFVGVMFGTFASIFVASPILLLFDRTGRGLVDLTEEEQKELDEKHGGAKAATDAAEAEGAAEPSPEDFEDKDEKKDDKKDAGGAAPATA